VADRENHSDMLAGAVFGAFAVPLGCAGLKGSLRVLVLSVVAVLAGSTSKPAFGIDGIGTATISQLSSCAPGGLSNGTCYEVSISDCGEISGAFIATAKINAPPNGRASKGAVFFSTGGGGQAYYDSDREFMGDAQCPGANCGLMVVQTVNSKDYTTIQASFFDPNNLTSEPAGWLTGPVSDGPRALACRYATLVHAVRADILKNAKSSPVCATGNSAGASAIAYALTQYGMGNSSGPGPTFTMVEATSGPPMGRIDHGCMGTVAPSSTVTCPAGMAISENYGAVTAASFIDPAYDGDKDAVSATDSLDVCTVDINSKGTRLDPRFHHDSIVSDDFPAPHYQTVIRVLFGSLDQGASVPQGLEWYNAVTSSKSQSCVSGAAHALPRFHQGAEAIINDLTTMCH
jgi:hypothetical protein